MKYFVFILSVAIFTVLLFFLLQNYVIPKNRANPAVSPFPTVTLAPQIIRITSVHQSLCHTDGILPDKNCTPGVVDPNVTQENIYSTICKSGYTKTVRPPAAYTNKLKAQQILEYGFTDTNPKLYEEDHLISLELGGSPTDPKNLWPEPGASPNPKDSIENLCNRKVCRGEVKLSDAQRMIAENWQTACQ